MSRAPASFPRDVGVLALPMGHVLDSAAGKQSVNCAEFDRFGGRNAFMTGQLTDSR